MIRSLLLSYLIINLFCHLSGGINPVSRLLTLISMTEDQSFQIDRYIENTPDWARTPEGHYYSNKAPGPMLLSFPVYFLMDKVLTWNVSERGERDSIRIKNRATLLRVLAFLFQVFPFLWITHRLARKLLKYGYSEAAVTVSVVALLFGNLGGIFMNTYYGHGLAAVLLLFCLDAMLDFRWFWVGFYFGWSLLCDYGCFWFLPALLWQLVRQVKLKNIWNFLMGGVLPGGLWVWYHTVCFGDPWSIPNKFQNPEFVDLPKGNLSLWGVIGFIPEPIWFLKLLFGTERGILFNQPWILLLLIVGLSRSSRFKVLCLTTFLGFLYMNASFGGWHGGLTPGPRYMIPCFPLMALWLGSLWDGFSIKLKNLFWINLAIAVFFSLAVYATHLSAPMEPLWIHYGNLVLNPTGTVVLRLGLFLVLAVILRPFSHR